MGRGGGGGGGDGGGDGGGKVFSNQSHCRSVVTCSQTDKVAFPDCSHPRLSYLTPKKYSYGEAGRRGTTALSR